MQVSGVLAALSIAAALLPSRLAIEPQKVPTEPPRRVIEVAVTVDDLPRLPLGPAQRPTPEVLGALVDAFKRHHLPPVTGFVNGAAAQDSADLGALQAWVRAGNVLGNHTYSHLDPARVPIATYLADIDRNERLLASLEPPPTWRTFRYPYLQEGSDAAMHRAIREHLLTRGYRIAPVTIDFKDWVWAPAYARCSAHANPGELELLRHLWLEHARESLRWSDREARRLLGHGMRQVLLVHATPYTAERMDDLLDDWSRAGVRFVSLESALQDPVLARDPDFASSFGTPLLHRIAYARTGALPASPEPPFNALDGLCR